MEPFVPEPEERINRKDSAAGKGKGGRNGHSNGEYSEGGSGGGVKAQLPLIVVALGLGILLWVSHGAKNAEIENLSAQIDSLKAEIQQSSPATDADQEDSAEAPSGDFTDRLGSLEKLVAEQVSDLETMRMMVAETLSKLDADLEGSLMGYYQRNSKAIEQLKGEMAVIAKLQAGVQEVQSSVKSLSATVDKTGSAQQDQQQRLAKIETQVTSQDKNLATATQADKQVIDRLAKVETQLVAQDKTVASASQADKQALDRLAIVESQLNSQEQKLTSAVQSGKQSGDKLATLDQNLKGLESKFADNQKQLAELKSGTGSNTQAIAAIKQAQDKNAGLLSSIQGSVDSLKSLNQSLATVKKDVAALNGELASKVSRRDLDNDLKKVTTSGNTQQSQKKIDELSSSLSAIRQELAARDKQFDQLRTQVAQGSKAQSAATVAATPTGSVDSKQLAAQLASIQRLESSQKQLSQEVSITQTQLASLSKQLKADLAKVSATKSTSAPATSVDLTALNKQLTGLTVQVAQTESKLKSQKSEFDSWKRDVDQNLAGTSVRLNALSDQGGQALDSKVDSILATIKVLKKQHPYADFPK